MNTKKQISIWQEKKLLDKTTAAKLLKDLEIQEKEQVSNRSTSIISVIGAGLLGLGAISFVASNWYAMSDAIKTLILVGGTFAAYIGGVSIENKLPRVAHSLIYLSTLLFGVTIFLLAQIYNVQVNNHWLLLVWLLATSPLAWTHKNKFIALISGVIFLCWVGFFIFAGDSFDNTISVSLPYIYLSAGLLVFSLGGFFYRDEETHGIARTLRLLGLKVALISLFVLTFKEFSGLDFYREISRNLETISLSKYLFVGLSALTMIILIFSRKYLSSNPVQNKKEFFIPLITILFTVLVYLFPLGNQVYTWIFNFGFIGIISFLISIGIKRDDMKIVDMGLIWVGIFAIAKYLDLIWNFLDKSLAFTTAGAVLIILAVILEKKHKQLKQKISKS